MQKVLIVGAGSAIATSVARLLADRGAGLCLAGRDTARLGELAASLRTLGASKVHVEALDARDIAAHEALLDRAEQVLGGLDTALIAHGTLPDQKECERSVAATLDALSTNALSVISLCSLLANRFERQRAGTIAVLGSVAGDRGRQSNYVYGTAKGAVAIFLQGLRNRLHESGVRVVTLKLGFVDTPMTAAFRKGPLWATPDGVAARIVRAMDVGVPQAYIPRFWRAVSLLIRLVPEALFKRTKL